jgi:TRAP transporter TAXI family solute receptor
MVSVSRRTVLAAMPGIALLGSGAAGDPAKLRIGTGAEGAAFLLYGTALVDGLKSTGFGLDIANKLTRGTLENVPLLEKGGLDIGFVSGEVVHELLTGIGAPPSGMKVISVMYPTAGMFAVRADSRFRTIADLRDRPVVWNSRGSGLAVQGRYVMDGLGLDAEKDFQPIYTERLSEGPQLVLDGRASALWGGGLRWPGFVTIASNARGARFVVPDAQECTRIMDKHRFLRRFTVPAGTYPGQYDPIASVGSWSFIMARADLDDDLAFRLATSLLRIEKAGLSPRQLGQSTVANTLAALPEPAALHPGVARFWRQQGLMP